MKKYLITFGVGTFFKNNVVIISADDEDKVRHYLFSKYGRQNVCGIYDYERAKYLIEKYHYSIIEETKI